MSSEAKRISDLSVATALSSTDRAVVLINPSSSANVKTITIANLATGIGGTLKGPFLNDTYAASGGVALKGLYYDTSGLVRIRTI
jgi:hypothetical protein